MNKTRIPTLVIVGSLVIAAVFTIRAYLSTTDVQATSPTFSTGFGDLRHYEAGQDLAGVPSAAAGFGELRRVEAQQALSASNARVVDPATSFSIPKNSTRTRMNTGYRCGAPDVRSHLARADPERAGT